MWILEMDKRMYTTKSEVADQASRPKKKKRFDSELTVEFCHLGRTVDYNIVTQKSRKWSPTSTKSKECPANELFWTATYRMEMICFVILFLGTRRFETDGELKILCTTGSDPRELLCTVLKKLVLIKLVSWEYNFFIIKRP